MHIGLDMDGVLVDCIGPALKAYGLSEADVTDFDLSTLPNGKEILAYMFQPGNFHRAQPYPGALAFVQALQAAHDVWLVSSPGHTAHVWSEKAAWVQAHLPALGKRLILTRDKSRCVFDVLLDDGEHNLHGNKSTYRLLFDQPWNRNIKDFCRVRGYQECLDFIKEVADE